MLWPLLVKGSLYCFWIEVVGICWAPPWEGAQGPCEIWMVAEQLCKC